MAASPAELITILCCVVISLPSWIFTSGNSCIFSDNIDVSGQPPTYQARIEISLPRTEFTVNVREYSDRDVDKWVVVMTAGTTQVTTISHQNEMSFFSGDSCTVGPLNSSFADSQFNSSVLTQYNFSEVFTVLATMKYGCYISDQPIKNTTVRGIDVIQRSRSVHWQGTNMTADYYLTSKLWNSPYSDLPVPVHVVCQVNKLVGLAHHHLFNITLNYFEYYSAHVDIPDEVLQPPRGFLCYGQKTPIQIPSLPSHFYYREEIVDSSEKVIYYADIWYDYKLQLLRIDESMNVHSLDPVSKVTDFSTGIQYIQHKTIGACSLQPITNSSVGAILKLNGSAVLYLQHPLQFLRLDYNYTNAGRKTVRGVNCNIFAARKDGYDYRYYFMVDDKWKSIPNSGKKGSHDIPFMLEIAKSTEKKLFTQYNFVDFNENPLDLSVFHISPCFSESSKLHVQLLIIGKYSDRIAEMLINETRFMLHKYTRLSFLRIQDIALDYDKDSISMTVTILENTVPASKVLTPSVKEISIQDAWKNLQTSIANGSFVVTVLNSDGSGRTDYKLMEAKVNYGYLKIPSKPVLLGQFSYHEEMIIPSSKSVSNVNFWYNQNLKLIRVDYRNTFPVAPFFSTGPLSGIHDFNTGVAYHIDRISGNCTITSVSSGSDHLQDYKTVLKDNSVIFKMRNPLEIFYMDNNYTFSGQRTVRGVLCDVYEIVQPDLKILDSSNATSTIRIFFMSANWNDIVDTATDVSKGFPVKMEVIGSQPNEFVIFNFYDFNDQGPDYLVFDTSMCFDKTLKTYFEIVFTGKNQSLSPTNTRKFLAASMKQLLQATKTPPLRFQNLAVDSNSRNVYLTVTLLETPPVLAHFVKFESLVRLVGAKYNMSAARECARKCLQNPTCVSFEICSQHSLCSFNFNLNRVLNKTCDHYSRVVNGKTYTRLHNKDIIYTLKSIIDSNGFVVSVFLQNSLLPFTATVLRELKSRTVKRQVNGENLKKFFIFTKGVAITKGESKCSSTLPDNCARMCWEEEAFSCQGFTYCDYIEECTLTKVHPEELGFQNFTQNVLCSTYSRKFTGKFMEFPGQSSLERTDWLVNATSINLCARACLSYSSCRSFQYCNNSGVCSLSKTHLMDIQPPKTTAPSSACFFFSRNYIDDFKLLKGKIIVGHDEMIVKGVKATDCAKMCVDEKQFQCKSFDFCLKNTSECRLSSIHMKGSQQFNITKSSTCNHYSRQYFPDGMIFLPNINKLCSACKSNQSVGSPSSSVFSSKMTTVRKFTTSGFHTTVKVPQSTKTQSSSISKVLTTTITAKVQTTRRQVHTKDSTGTTHHKSATLNQIKLTPKDNSASSTCHCSCPIKSVNRTILIHHCSYSGYTSGSMAAVAITMILLGIGLTFLTACIKKLALKRRNISKGQHLVNNDCYNSY